MRLSPGNTITRPFADGGSSNAVSFLKLLKRVVVKLDSWRKESSDIFLGSGDSEEGALAQTAPALRTAVQALCQTLYGHLATREAALSRSIDPTARLEASTLRLLTYDIIERPHAGLSADNRASVPIDISETMKRILDGMVANREVGAAWVLAGELFANNIPPSDDATANLRGYWKLGADFRSISKTIWESCFKPVIQDEESKHEIEMFIAEPYVFDSSHWMLSMLPLNMKEFWPTRDCLGTSVLHVLLYELGQMRRDKGITQEPTELAKEIASHCREHDLADRSGRSAIHIATQNNLPDVVQALMDEGISPNSETRLGRTALHFAAALGYSKVCESLINRADGEDVNYADKYGRTPLHYACRLGKIDVIKILLRHSDILVNQQDRQDETPLMAALLSERARTASGQTRSRHGNDVRGLGGVPRLLARMETCAYKVFFRNPRVDFSLQNKRGKTALHVAVLQNNFEAVEDLVPYCAKFINTTDIKGRTALCCAAKQNAEEDIVKSLLKVPGIDSMLTDYRGESPLSYAMSHNNHRVASQLNAHISSASLAVNPVYWDEFQQNTSRSFVPGGVPWQTYNWPPQPSR